ncbi:MAG: iron-containing alcohol dehydrogenase [Planctomycetota bacterium]|nr:MAG: iron-containing alcohol dehydrogenase [Planctomycetota bacterium]
MKNFNYYQPTEIRFGCGRLSEAGEVAAKLGKRCLLVTVPAFAALEPVFDKVKASLADAGVEVAHFDGVVPNPTTESITAGAKAAKAHKADVVLGLGGGSSMDSAKAIAVEASHKGTCWDYLWFSETQPTEKTLPVIAVTTTSGTGSHVTQVAVVTNTEKRDKSAIYNPIVYPRVSIVDPELMVTVPEHVTASTGFDVFCHAFETYIHPNASPYTDIIAEEAIRLVAKYLPVVVKDGANIEARTAMAWADTLAGLCIANAGVTLPHGMGMAIGGMYPHVMHGEALAVTYPDFMRYTYRSALKQFATVGRIFNSALESESDETAAEKSCEEIDRLLKEIGMWLTLDGLKVPEDELPQLAEQCLVLPDYKSNPKVATPDDVSEILKSSYRR